MSELAASRLLTAYVIAIIGAATMASMTGSTIPDREVFVFLLKATMLWAGLVWVSVSVYISLISDDEDSAFNVWISFTIGALMIYLGISGVYLSNTYWLGVRTVLYLMLSLIAVIFLEELQRVGDYDPVMVKIRKIVCMKNVKRIHSTIQRWIRR